MIHQDTLAWRKSSFSGGGGDSGANCIEMARLRDGGFAVRDSKNPGADALTFSRPGVVRLIDDLRAR